MAYDPEVIDQLRRFIGDAEEPYQYSDEQLTVFLDEADGDTRAAANRVWTSKAAEYLPLVDITEAGSSRKMGDLYKRAIDMAAKFETPVEVPEVTIAAPLTRGIVRT